MLAISDNSSLWTFCLVFFFEIFRQISAVGLRLLSVLGVHRLLLDPWGPLRTPQVGVTTVGPKDVLVLGPSLNNIQRSSLGKSHIYSD